MHVHPRPLQWFRGHWAVRRCGRHDTDCCHQIGFDVGQHWLCFMLERFKLCYLEFVQKLTVPRDMWFSRMSPIMS